MAVSSLSGVLSYPLPAKSPHPSLSTSFSQQLRLPKIKRSRWTPLVAINNKDPAAFLLSSTGTIDAGILPVLCPSLAYAKILYFETRFNVQIDVEDNKTEDRIIRGFGRAALKAGVLQELKRRRFFENSREKKKRKARDAARRNLSRRPRKKVKDKRRMRKMMITGNFQRRPYC